MKKVLTLLLINLFSAIIWAQNLENINVRLEDNFTKIIPNSLCQKKKIIDKTKFLKDGFTDERDNNYYTIVTIGNQIWMAENLKYFTEVVGPATGSNTEPYCYVYGYDGTDVEAAKEEENYQTYGVIYNYEAAQNVCPADWHLPTQEEWTELIDFAGGLDKAAAKLKEAGDEHWNGEDPRVTNETGFTAIPGGYRKSDGGFGSMGANGYWWGVTSLNQDKAVTHGMYYATINVGEFYDPKSVGASVRCVSDFLPSGIKKYNANNIKISIYPNPTSDYVTLQVKDIKLNNIQLQLFNIKGQLLKNENVTESSVRIDMRDLATGNYFIKIKQGSELLKSIKIVKS